MSIAIVLSISGQAWARDASGNLRELRVGDTLQEGETVVTSTGGEVQLDFGDNLDPSQIEGGEQVLITQELSTDQPVEASEFAALDEDLDALLAALDDETVDLLDVLDATAAGAGPGGAADGGHSFVRLARIAEDTNPLAFDYGLNALGGPPEEQGGAFLAETADDVEVVEPVIIQPTAGSVELDLADALVGQSGSVVSGVLLFTFGNGVGGSVSFANMHGVEVQIGQETILYSWDASSNTLTAFSPARELNIFTIEVNPTTGAFILTQWNNLLHEEGADAALANLTYTVTSSSGSATGTLQLTIVDDIPGIEIGAAAELASLLTTDAALGTDSAALRDFFTIVDHSFGGDGAAAGGGKAWHYSLSLGNNVAGNVAQDGSGENLTSGSQLVYLHLIGGSVVGSTAASAANVNGGNTVFVVSLVDGKLVLDPIDHPTASNASEVLHLAGGQILLTGSVTLTDADGDTATDSATVDLGGQLGFEDDGPSLSALNLAIANVAGIYEGVYEFEVGGDVQSFLGSFGEGSLNWTGMPDGYALTITDSGETWITYTAKSGSFEFFNLTLNADGTYAFDLLSPAPVVETEIESLLSAFDSKNLYQENGKTAYLFTSDVFNGKFALAVTAFSNSVQQNVSMSSTDLGVHSNVVQGNKKDMLRFDVRPEEGSGEIGVTSFIFSVSGTSGSKAGDQAKLTVFDMDGTSKIYTATLVTADGEFVFNIDPTHNVDYMELQPAGNNSFKIDGISTSYLTQIYPDDYQLDFVLTGSDADGDTATADFSVFVKTSETGSYEITGSDGDDVVHGTAGDDILIGGAGNDTLIGGEGDDVFQWNLGDQGDSDAPAIDTVVDFGLGTNNVLDLADLLQGESVSNIGDFIFAAQEGASTVLYIHHEGQIDVDGGNATQVIVLENFTTGEVGSAEILAELLANSQLNIDP
ncbi:retention module-containing protein [Billgrantia ethanolica]|uniref:Retention module-containing protein n=1 Tax=Billgrantia ethanolica TaxID=2733486 RepID=A0ABS9A2H6_9GAMM|nr:retention module-containing protein [Halomonas ethanolica]MCE8002280.1 retention module-containing protein [Halomonas ethanolica]